jgi:hypothetical protein
MFHDSVRNFPIENAIERYSGVCAHFCSKVRTGRRRWNDWSDYVGDRIGDSVCTGARCHCKLRQSKRHQGACVLVRLHVSLCCRSKTKEVQTGILKLNGA